MRYEELKRLYGDVGRKRRGHPEHDIQAACVRWFRLAFRRYLVFAVPNGGYRMAKTAAEMKVDGQMAGVADLVVLAEGRVLFVEMKTPSGKQNDAQKEFERRVTALGFRYVVCRSLDDFMREVTAWLRE